MLTPLSSFLLPCKCVNNPYYPWIHIWKRDIHGYKGRYPSNTRHIFWGLSCRDWKRVAHGAGGNRWYSVVVMGWRASYDMGILCHYFLIHSSILLLGCSPWKPTLTLLVVFLKWFLLCFKKISITFANCVPTSTKNVKLYCTQCSCGKFSICSPSSQCIFPTCILVYTLCILAFIKRQ